MFSRARDSSGERDAGRFLSRAATRRTDRLIPHFEWGLQAAVEATRWAAGFEFPDFEADYDFVALVHPDEYALNEGRVVSSRGDSWAVDDFEQEFEERQVPHSTALQAVRRSTQGAYFVGPMARVHLSFDLLSEIARRTADEIGFAPPCRIRFVASSRAGWR